MENSILQTTELCNNVKLYREGKRDFSAQDLNDIKLYLLKYKDVLEGTEFFQGELKGNRVVSCFGSSFHKELLDYMINKLSASISIIVEIESRKIFFQKNEKTCSVDICELAKILCDGTCLDNDRKIAQGSLTNNFLKFTKKLIPCILAQ